MAKGAPADLAQIAKAIAPKGNRPEAKPVEVRHAGTLAIASKVVGKAAVRARLAKLETARNATVAGLATEARNRIVSKIAHRTGNRDAATATPPVRIKNRIASKTANEMDNRGAARATPPVRIKNRIASKTANKMGNRGAVPAIRATE